MTQAIGELITSAIGWFVDIFSGLSEAFVTTVDGQTQLTVWGSVLFIGVAIMLVMVCLRWVISLVRGV